MFLLIKSFHHFLTLVPFNIYFLQVASFPFDDHNCPPVQLIISFCHSAYAWLKEDIENVVVVHCKAGMARTGLMISSLLLYLKVPILQFYQTTPHTNRISIVITSPCSFSPQLRSLYYITTKKDVLMEKDLFFQVK